MTPSTPEQSEVILYGMISVTIVSLLSLGGAVIGPLLKNDKHRWLHFFLAMAVSTLSSDAILHIIPQVVGVHNHGGGHGHSHGHENVTNSSSVEHHHHHHEEEEEGIMWHTMTSERETLLRLSVIVLSIYILYFIEFFMFYRKTHVHYCSSPLTARSPSQKEQIPIPTTCSSSVSSGIESESDTYNNNDGQKNGAISKLAESVESVERRRERGGHELVNLQQDDQDDGAEICGLKPRALIILFGDGLHNLVDGIAIGASFMMSLKLGLITTIAVVCHELPHEIGDLAVLIDSGLSMTRALILNLLSALTAYLGLFVAIVLGENKNMETVLLAVTAGMFLYVAWVDMLSHLKHDTLMSDNWIVTAILQISGFTVGFLLIFALGWFEHLLGH